MKKLFKQEWAKLRIMNAAEVRWYLWEYYRLHFAAIILVLAFIGYIINITFVNPRVQDYVYVAWVVTPIPHFQLREIGDGLSVIVENPERQTVSITDYSFTDNPQMNMALQTRFIGLLQLGNMDVFFTTYEGVMRFIEDGFIRPVYEVTDYLAESNPRVYADLRLLVVEEYTAAISMENSLFLYNLGINTEDLYLCVVANTERFFEISKAVEVLLDGA